MNHQNRSIGRPLCKWSFSKQEPKVNVFCRGLSVSLTILATFWPTPIYKIGSVHRSLRAHIYTQLSCNPKTAFQWGWGLDFKEEKLSRCWNGQFRHSKVSPGPVVAKPAKIITLPPACLTVGMQCLWWCTLFINKHLHLSLKGYGSRTFFLQSILFQNFVCFVQLQLFKSNFCSHILYLFSLFLIVPSWTLHISCAYRGL